DRIAIAVAVIAGLIAGVVPGWLGWAIIIREVLIAVGVFYGWSKGVTRLDVRQMGKLATLLLYSAIIGLYIAVGFEIAWVESVSAVIGLIGIVLYYAVGIAYFGDLLATIKANEAA
ncbi:MAG: CDP-alcohol phosphatidyltransferase family protein, partial [Acidimicrobiia bacterium]